MGRETDTAASRADTAAPRADTAAPRADIAAPRADTAAPRADSAAPKADAAVTSVTEFPSDIRRMNSAHKVQYDNNTGTVYAILGMPMTWK